jgi:hypothetical protein
LRYPLRWKRLHCGARSDGPGRFLLIHDRSATERRVQTWADRWRLIESRIGVLTHLVDVPLFADSQASRLLQAADFVAWSLWRYYGLASADERWIKPLWSHFDHSSGSSWVE